MYRSFKFWIILIVVVLVGATSVAFYFLTRDSSSSSDRSAAPEPQPILIYENQAHALKFVLPETFDFFDVGVPVDNQVMVERSVEPGQTLYLQHKALPLVLDLNINFAPSSSDLPPGTYRADKTSQGLAVHYYEADCRQWAEPVFWLQNPAGREILVKVEELCEEDEVDLLDLDLLMSELAEAISF